MSAGVGGRLSIQGLRAVLAAVFLLMGAQKFTLYEAQAIRPFVGHSPFLAWTYPLFGLRGASILLGVIETAVGLGLVFGLARPRAWPSLAGAAGAVAVTFVTTSFLFTTPGALVFPHGAPRFSLEVGQFFMKDAVMLAGSAVVLAAALEASGRRA